ncbi:MAG: response regulator [Polyangiaceae bacterium]|nr:response regulator [Polyangiaceae bacterium]
MSRRILVVDDELDILQAVCGILEDEGYEVIGCGSGQEAIAALSSACPSLILLDVMMPYMSGYEVLDALRKMPSMDGVPVVLMSAAPPKDKPSAERCTAFLRKPFNIDKLLATVKDCAVV